MNANELADELDNLGHNYANQTEIVIKSAVMLRQQQAEIEALKEQLAIMKNDLAFAGHDFNKIILQLQKAQEK